MIPLILALLCSTAGNAGTVATNSQQSTNAGHGTPVLVRSATLTVRRQGVCVNEQKVIVVAWGKP